MTAITARFFVGCERNLLRHRFERFGQIALVGLMRKAHLARLRLCELASRDTHISVAAFCAAARMECFDVLGKIDSDNGFEICKNTNLWAIGAAGAQVPYKHKVGGSNP